MIETKAFTLEDVLCISTKRLVSSRGMDAIYDVLNWMADDNLFTHQLPRAMRECQPWLLRWFPELDAVNGTMESLDRHIAQQETPALAVVAWMAEIQAQLPLRDSYDVPRIPRDDHEYISPVAEAESMFGKDRVIPIQIDRAGE